MQLGRFAVIPLLLLLQGCATNALRTEYAGAVAERSAAAAQGARRFLAQVDASRLAANIELAAADPACARVSPLLRQPPDIGADAPRVGFLCVNTKLRSPPPGVAISLLPLAEELEPTLRLTEALGAYGEAIASLIEDDPVDPAQPLLDALSLALAAQDALNAVIASSPTPIPVADDPRVSAIAGLVNFFGELNREARQVTALRRHIAEDPDRFKQVMAPLRRQLTSWERARSADVGILKVVEDASVQAVLLAEPPKSAEMRRAALERYYSKEAARRDEARIAPALFRLFDAVEEADADLRRVLAENPDVNDKERRRIAALNRERIIAGLKHVASLANAIRGA
jgi:hypothetical protein